MLDPIFSFCSNIIEGSIRVQISKFAYIYILLNKIIFDIFFIKIVNFLRFCVIYILG